MSTRSKRIFLALCIVVPYLFYCVYYYGMVFKNAPYKFAEFDSMSIQYGIGDSLINKYSSKTGDYQYVNKQDSLVKVHLRLSKDDLLYLHRKASDLGFWDFPVNEISSLTKTSAVSPHYLIEFKYKRKSKKVLFDSAFDGDAKLKDANERLVKEILRVLADAESKQKK